MTKSEKEQSNEELIEIVKKFEIDGELVSFNSLKRGHINDTFISEWKIANGTTNNTTNSTKRFIHQRVNHYVFKNVPLLMENVAIVTRHVEYKIPAGSSECTLQVIPTKMGATYLLDKEKDFWRTYNYIENTKTLDFCPDKNTAIEASQCFGRFLGYLQDLPVHLLRETIPSFQSVLMRIEQFHQALKKDSKKRAESVKEEIKFVLDREDMAGVLDKSLAEGRIPKRVTHNDLKLNNLLLSQETGKGICVVDLDTCMPGTALYDFGDFIMNICVSAAEDEKDLSKVVVDEEILESAIRGFIVGAGDYFTPAELEIMPFAPRIIALNIGARFLTDYLNGDIYFKTHRTEHNLDRCRTRFKIVDEMEKKEELIRGIIHNLR